MGRGHAAPIKAPAEMSKGLRKSGRERETTMSSYIITFTASVKFEASTRIGFQIARDAIEEAVAEALPGLDTFDFTKIVKRKTGQVADKEKVVTVPGGTGTRPIL